MRWSPLPLLTVLLAGCGGGGAGKPRSKTVPADLDAHVALLEETPTDVVLAIAPVSGGTRELPPCRPAKPISVLDLHGTSDPIVAYTGRGPQRDGRVADVMARWARIDGCDAAATRSRARPRVTRFVWRGCDAGVRVEHLALERGGHAWPTRDSTNTVRFDAAETIWRFFARAEPRE